MAVKDLQSELALEKTAHNATKQLLIEEQGRFATQLQELQVGSTLVRVGSRSFKMN